MLQIGTEWRQSIWSLGSNDKGTCTLYTKAIGRKENRPIERRVTRVFSERIRRRAIIKYQISWISRNFKITHVNLPAGLTKYASIYICIHTHIKALKAYMIVKYCNLLCWRARRSIGKFRRHFGSMCRHLSPDVSSFQRSSSYSNKIFFRLIDFFVTRRDWEYSKRGDTHAHTYTHSPTHTHLHSKNYYVRT